jgi:hypothetical protein
MSDDKLSNKPVRIIAHTYIGHQRAILPGHGVVIQFEVEAGADTGQTGRLYYNFLIRSEDARFLAESLLDGIEKAAVPPKEEQH